MKTDNERRTDDANRLWEVIGEHGEAIKSLQVDKYQTQQSLINHRAETNGHLEKIEDRVERIMTSIEEKLENFLTPLLQRVGRIEKFMYIATGGGAALTALVYNFDKIKLFVQVFHE